jgi:hypothetical protein
MKSELMIDDLLVWQEKMDNAPAPINMRGFERFWTTTADFPEKRSKGNRIK